MGDYIVLGILVVILAAVIIYLVRQKKKGVKCVGCPHGKSCSSCSCNCAAGTHLKDDIK